MKGYSVYEIPVYASEPSRLLSRVPSGMTAKRSSAPLLSILEVMCFRCKQNGLERVLRQMASLAPASHARASVPVAGCFRQLAWKPAGTAGARDQNIRNAAAAAVAGY